MQYSTVNMRVRPRGKGQRKRGVMHAHWGTLPLSTLLASCTVGRVFPRSCGIESMADKGDDGMPKVQETTSDQPAEDGETAAIIR